MDVIVTYEHWFATDHVSCGDVPIDHYRTDGRPTPTAPRGRWTHMRGTDRQGRQHTFERRGDGWAEMPEEGE